MKIAYTNGRYQPLHNGHFRVMLNLLDKYDELWIGIANPLRAWLPQMDSLEGDLRKSIEHARAPENNPYTFVERYQMIENSLLQAGLSPSRYKILPHIGYYEHENWTDFIPKGAVICIPAKDLHHLAKVEMYEKLGYKVEILSLIEGICGADFDREWPNGKWRDLVPIGTREILEKKLLTHS